MRIVIGATAILMYINMVSPAYATTFTLNDVIEIKPSDIKPHSDGGSYVTKRITNNEWITIQKGDTLSGTIRFANNLSFSSLYSSSITPTFQFLTGSSPAIGYGTSEKTVLISENGERSRINFLRSYCTFLCYSLNVYSGRAEKMNSISSLEYNVNFERLDDINNKPIQIRLSSIHVSKIAGLATAVPEPSSWLMMILGLFGIGLATRRRRTTATVALA